MFAPICREIFTLSFEIMVILDWTSSLKIGTGLAASAAHPRRNQIWVPPPPPPGVGQRRGLAAAGQLERQPDASWQFQRLAFSRSKRIKLVPEPRIFKIKTAQARSGAPHFQAQNGSSSFRSPAFSSSKRLKLVPEPRIFKLKTAQARSGAPHFQAQNGSSSFRSPAFSSSKRLKLVPEPLPIFHFAAAHTYQNLGWVPPPPPRWEFACGPLVYWGGGGGLSQTCQRDGKFFSIMSRLGLRVWSMQTTL